MLCEAAGYDLILVETVGIGQSETLVATVTDLFLLLVAPGGGDDLQGIKRGVMELADVIVVNKADGELANVAQTTAADYEMAMHLTRPKRPSLPATVQTCSALERTGIEEIWDALRNLNDHLRQNGVLTENRNTQAARQLREEIAAGLTQRAFTQPTFAKRYAEAEAAVKGRQTTVSAAARRLTETLFSP